MKQVVTLLVSLEIKRYPLGTLGILFIRTMIPPEARLRLPRNINTQVNAFYHLSLNIPAERKSRKVTMQ